MRMILKVGRWRKIAIISKTVAMLSDQALVNQTHHNSSHLYKYNSIYYHHHNQHIIYGNRLSDIFSGETKTKPIDLKWFRNQVS